MRYYVIECFISNYRFLGRYNIKKKLPSNLFAELLNLHWL